MPTIISTTEFPNVAVRTIELKNAFRTALANKGLIWDETGDRIDGESVNLDFQTDSYTYRRSRGEVGAIIVKWGGGYDTSYETRKDRWRISTVEPKRGFNVDKLISRILVWVTHHKAITKKKKDLQTKKEEIRALVRTVKKFAEETLTLNERKRINIDMDGRWDERENPSLSVEILGLNQTQAEQLIRRAQSIMDLEEVDYTSCPIEV